MHLWPDTLAGRTLSLLIAMTLVLIIGSAWLLHDERRERFDERNRFHLLDRVVTLARLLEDADDEERLRIIERVAGRGDDIVLGDQPRVNSPSRHPLEHRISHELRRRLHLDDKSSVRVRIAFDGHERGFRDERDGRHKLGHPRDFGGVSISIRLWEGEWLNVHTDNFKGPPPWAGKTLQLLALLLVLVILSGLYISRRMARPMAQLADAANRFGLGQAQPPLAEKGPREVRNTVRAFNQMQERLQRHISDRSQMLAAVSHDLRTPITTLRLRAEYIEDDEMREKTLATLAEMESILSATLGFARDEAADEAARSTDLAALLTSLLDDHADLGGDVNYTGPEKLVFLCRPIALKRALNNLIDNGLKYGASVAVRLNELSEGVKIVIDDAGPGIPEESLEAVFTPFYRLEASRNRETGGTGLGLAVARTIVYAHGGKLSLMNRPEGGLRAKVWLPHYNGE
ncbi:MAG: ATP-binding protein [Candidatus Thiodiazotropha endolucinida]|uniref:histidine kinase n=1 Tax=Candidatus Thiodiazotropha taylori TaxID=2792791 RepID=A0A9E4NKY8_9GAMM|nr:HAMP domain-containing protein [Candidatus Thiodiazotropha taylori]MBT3039879.1 HAMP domain-containing protein [Candidatus Thiodiazotropha sp. (ex Codakia orbicularis)]MCG7863399.1 ATP-binding protein [Candidatus Thiodiazotropha endolucinida]MBT3044532.1 HAMP domain-containing protein [Candidatus Thiodiazotropha sp. (ex Codakia orbicularis)]MBT3056061.1 HAMP domain-containing protein [Candidatus Thiodiazotropha sp. (ex Codakia orbicularis)]